MTCNGNQITGSYMIQAFMEGVSEQTAANFSPNYQTQSKRNVLKCYFILIKRGLLNSEQK